MPWRAMKALLGCTPSFSLILCIPEGDESRTGKGIVLVREVHHKLSRGTQFSGTQFHHLFLTAVLKPQMPVISKDQCQPRISNARNCRF